MMATTRRSLRAPRRRPAVAVLAAVAALLLAALAGATGADAHASLVGSAPPDGTVLASSPGEVTLAFNEPVAPLVLRLVDADGGRRDLEAVRDDLALRVRLPPDLAEGTYAVSWRVVSEDGHPVGGSLVFSIGAPGRPPPQLELGDPAVAAAIVAARIALFAGLFFGIGGAVFAAWIAPAGARAPARAALAAAFLLGLAAAPLSLGLQGLDALGAPLGRLDEPVVWATGFSTRYGLTVPAALTALALGLVALAALPGPAVGAASRPAAAIRRRTAARILAAVAVVTAGGGLAASGHAANAEPHWLTRPAVFLHTAAVALWIGALAPLAVLLARRGEGDGAAAALARFSRWIPVALGPLLAAGVVLACVQVEAPAALWSTAYGGVLLVKLALVAGLLGLAAWNRLGLTRPALAGEPAARRRLVRSIAAEAGLALAILAVAALWRFTPPPRALAAAAAMPAEIHIHAARAMADVTIAPGRAGPVGVSIIVMTGDFGPLDPKEMRLTLENPAAGIAPIRRAAVRPGAGGGPPDGIWRVEDLTIPVPGRWSVRLDVLVSDFETVALEGAIDIRP